MLLTTLLTLALAGAPAPLGAVEQVSGTVRILDGEGYTALKTGQSVFPGDRVLVLGEGQVRITGTECVVEVREPAVITLGADCAATQVHTATSGMSAFQGAAVIAGLGVVLEDIVLETPEDRPASP